jgi:hypothetical protein
MKQYVPAEQLWTTFKGDLDFEYDHSVYWPAMIKLTTERREARKARWEAGGKHIGESEDYLSGHAPTGVAGSKQSAVAPAADTKAEEPKEAAPVEEKKTEEAPKEDATPAKAEIIVPVVETKAEEAK